MCQEQNKADVAKYLPKYFWNFCRALSMICIAKRVIFRYVGFVSFKAGELSA